MCAAFLRGEVAGVVVQVGRAVAGRQGVDPGPAFSHRVRVEQRNRVERRIRGVVGEQVGELPQQRVPFIRNATVPSPLDTLPSLALVTATTPNTLISYTSRRLSTGRSVGE